MQISSGIQNKNRFINAFLAGVIILVVPYAVLLSGVFKSDNTLLTLQILVFISIPCGLILFLYGTFSLLAIFIEKLAKK